MSRKTDLSFLTLPRYETQSLMREVVIRGGSGVASSDWHLPLTSESAVLHLINEAKRRKATDWLAIAGDWFNFDALSDYLPKQRDHELYDEIIMSRRLMRILLSLFDVVYVGVGNHDVRLVKALGHRMRFEHSMELCFGSLPEQMLNRLVFTGRDYLLHTSPEGDWRFCHTNQYAATQLTRPAKIADTFQQHVLTGHAHHHALGRSPSGLWIGEMGGMFDVEKTVYIKRWTTTHPRMAQGYFVLRDGVPSAPMLHG
jgi:hypothetical protein